MYLGKRVELHIHLDGSLRPETVLELGIRYNIIPEHFTLTDVMNLLTVDSNNTDLVSYLKRFNLPIEILQTTEAIERAAYELVEDLAKENTIYAEIRVAPIQHLRSGLTPEQVVDSILTGFHKAEAKFNIKANLLLCAMRHLPPGENRFLIDLAHNYRNKGVVGLDLAGDEAGYPPSIFRDFFRKAKELGIPFTIHAGEARGADSISEAISIGASRLGHGIRAYEDKNVLELIAAHNICLECCPVSNFDTNAIKDFYNYPIIKYLEKGLDVTLNSDNRTVSNTSYKKEVELLQHYINIKNEHIKQMNINAIKHAFIPETLKERLLNEIKQIH